MSIEIRPGMSLGEFLSQEVSDEEWDAEWDPAPKAPPQDFIGPRVFPPKFLRCSVCDEWIQVSDKYRRAKTATHAECRNKEPDRSEV